MKKIFLILFATVSFIANAQIPGVNDSIYAEISESENYNMFLKSLPDSIQESPMVTKVFSEIGSIGNINISLFEHYPLNSPSKDYYLKLNISDAISSLGISMSYDDVKSIINILEDIHKNTSKLRLSKENEYISYKKIISSRSLFAITLSYNPQKDKWSCQIDISIINPTNYIGKSVIIYQDLDYTKSSKLKDPQKNIPKLINLLNQGLSNIYNRKYNYFEPQLKTEYIKDSRVKYYIDKGDNLNEKYANTSTNAIYSDEILKENYITDLNLKINKYIDNSVLILNKLDNFGVAEIVVDKSGQVICSNLILTKIASDALNEKTIAKILSTINDYKLKKIGNSYNGINLIKVFIPLKGYPQF